MSLLQDLRFAIRLLVKDRWFTAVAVVALALGIGVNSTVFTLVNAVLIRGLPFDEPDRIMALGTRDARNRDRMSSYLDFEDWRTGTRAFAGLAAFSPQTMNVSDEGRAPERFGGPVHLGERVRADRRTADHRPRLPARRRSARRGAGGAARQRHLEEPIRQRPDCRRHGRSRSTSCRRRSSA